MPLPLQRKQSVIGNGEGVWALTTWCRTFAIRDRAFIFYSGHHGELKRDEEI